MILTEKDIDALGLASATKADVQCIESALLEKLRQGVEVPEPLFVVDSEMSSIIPAGTKMHAGTALLRYGDALALAAREQAIEECARECMSKHANGNYKYDTREDCHLAILDLPASPQEQT